MNKGESIHDICRVCCSQKRSLKSLFHKVKSNTYADLIRFLTNVKIQENDCHSNKICKICRTKAEEAHEFVNMVVRVDAELHGTDAISPKKFQFDNINEIKIEIDPIKTENIPCNNKPLKHFDDTSYNDVSIKKIIKAEPEEITFEDFVHDNDIDYDIGDDGDDYYEDCDDKLDEDYGPPNQKKPKPTKKLPRGDADYEPRKQTKPKPDPNRKPIGRPRKVLPEIEADLEPIIMEDLLEKPHDNKPQPILKPIELSHLRVAKPLIRRKPRIKEKEKPRKPESICPYCGKLCKNINSHILTHSEREFKCSVCPRSYLVAAQLKNHMIIHSGVKNFECDKCHMKFFFSHMLKSHLASHKEIRDHVCEICSKTFKRRHGLRRHMIRHNSANKRVSCELCNMTFFEKGQLKAHMRIHTGERPNKCELCSQPYSYKPDFNRHCFKKHGVFTKRRNLNVMNQEVLDKERIDVKAMFERSTSISLPTPLHVFPCIIDEAQLTRLFGNM